MNHQRVFLPTILIGLIMALLMSNGLSRTALAAPQSQEASPTPTPKASSDSDAPEQLSISDDLCLSCHGQPGQIMTLDNGDVLDLYIPAEDHQNSVHGELGYACVQCHRQVGNYPHPAFKAADARDASLRLYEACRYCHELQYEMVQDSVHAAALAKGERAAAICTDCHSAHTVQQLNDPETGALTQEARLWIPQTCARCHNAIYQKYLTSVHGSALTEGNPDVPTCIDCHDVHNIPDPTTAAFRLNSPQLCASCHTDPAVVGKYGLSTDVLNTYVADFHGTTVVLFEKQSPEDETNKPVCYDCHGVHDISRSDDPEKGLQVRQNLLARCQVCHPDATDNFPTAWLSHYIPSPEKNPIVYYVNLFYKFFIPGVLGSMGVLVVLDFGRASLNRIRRRRPDVKIQEEPADTTILAQGIEETESAPTSEETVTPDEATLEAAMQEVEAVEVEKLTAEQPEIPGEIEYITPAAEGFQADGENDPQTPDDSQGEER